MDLGKPGAGGRGAAPAELATQEVDPVLFAAAAIGAGAEKHRILRMLNENQGGRGP